MVFRAGYAVADINPDRSVPLAGTFSERMSEGVHDPLTAGAIVVDDGERTLGHVSMDLISAHGGITAAIRQRVADEGLDVDAIMISTTHTHTGPELPGRHIDRRDAYDLDDVVERVIDGAVDAITLAADRRSAATIRTGRAENRNVTINRRSRGGLLGEVDVAGRDVDEQRDVDPELSMLLIEPNNGSPVALYNFPCHTTTMTSYEISADWPYFAAKRVKEEWPELHTSFINGAAGDIVPRDSYDWQDTYETKAAFSESIGTEIGESVTEAVVDAQTSSPVSTPTVRSSERTVDLEVKHVNPTKVKTRREELERKIEEEHLSTERPLGHPITREYEFLGRDLNLHEAADGFLSTTLQSMRIGPVTVISLPGEPLVDHGLDLKSRMDAPVPMIAGYTNDHLGYLPTPDEIAYGGYEVLTRKLSADGINKLRKTAFELASEVSIDGRS